MSIGNCETIDLNNSRIHTSTTTTSATHSTHETNDLSSSINSNNLNNTSKISTTGTSSEQTASSSAKTNNGENMNKALEEKKRKLTLPLFSGDDKTKCTNTSSDSINGSNSNSIGFLSLSSENGVETNLNKKLKAAYFDNGGFFSNETPLLNSKDIVKCLDKCNTLPTPQIDKLIHDFNPNIKTPNSALAILGSGTSIFTPGTDNIILNLINSDPTTPGISSINPNVIFSNSFGATTTGAASAAAVVIAPSISGVTTTNINNNNNTSNNNSTNTSNYAMLTNVSNTLNNTGNFLLINGPVDMTDKNPARLDYKNYGDNMLSNKSLNLKDEKDNNFLQTVPVHPSNLANDTRSLNSNNNASTTTSNNNNRGSSTSAQNKSRGKPASKTVKSASIKKSSESFSDLITSTPNTSAFSRRDTGNSTTSSSSNLDTSFSPINLDKQETLKLEKKRERNREAARKCRTRKLEKIAQLETQVKTLTENNEAERAKTDKLREEINLIKIKLEQHKKIHNCDLKLTI